MGGGKSKKGEGRGRCATKGRRATKGEPRTDYGGPGRMPSDESPRRERIALRHVTSGDVSDRLIAARLRYGKTEPAKLKNVMRVYLKGPLKALKGVKGRRAASNADAPILVYGPVRVPLDAGGYTPDGRYFGRSKAHGHVYEYDVQDPFATRSRFGGVRAHSIAEAREKIRAEYPRRVVKFVK